jgi:hypothetical protein
LSHGCHHCQLLNWYQKSNAVKSSQQDQPLLVLRIRTAVSPA